MSETRSELCAYVAGHTVIPGEPDVLSADAANIIHILENCEIRLTEANSFFVTVDTDYVMNEVLSRRAAALPDMLCGLADGVDSRAYSGVFDFSHTMPEWDTILRLGFVGLRERLTEYRAGSSGDPAKTRFYDTCVRVWDAALRFLSRAADAADEAGRGDIAEIIRNIAKRPPETLSEACSVIIAYYVFQHKVSGTYLRSLGRLDSLLHTYFIKEERGTAIRIIHDFIREIDTLKAPSNIPFALGGSGADGGSLLNELSYVILEAYRVVPTINTKLHILCRKDTPDDFLALAFRCVREGKNSIVFMSDDKIVESLEKLGAEPSDARDYHVVGCYECGARGELTCSCSSRVSIPKAVETALNGGRDMLTGKQIGPENDGHFRDFEEFFDEVTRQLLYFVDCAVKITDNYERNYRYLHSEPFMSSVYESSVERGADLYCDYSAKYNNSSINALGLGTAVDSLAAVRKLVFEDGTLTTGELADILRNDWKGFETLRLRVKNRFPKYGMADKKTDELAARLVGILGKAVDGRPNAKGGVYRLGTFSIDWRWDFGRAAAASADGRHSGETISQNTSASFGADRNGATAHLISAASIDTSLTPNGSITDLDLHSSAVAGERGTDALATTLRTFFGLGGFAVHYNILDTKTLEAARKRPGDYPDLQVRLCGWNVLFSSLSDKEKDEFIARSKKEG